LPKRTEFGRITQNIRRYAVQGHSRSPISLPVESSYHATSYVMCIVTFIYPISHRLRDMADYCERSMKLITTLYIRFVPNELLALLEFWLSMQLLFACQMG